MKKTMITLGLVLLAGVTSFGQAKKTQTSYTSLGPVAGFGHSWMSNMDNQPFKPSAYLGIGIIYSRFEHWGWGGELIASHEGYKQDYTVLGNSYRTAVDPTYVRLTPKAYYFFGDYKNNVRPKVYLGPSVAVKVQEDRYTENVTMNQSDVIMATSTAASVFRTMDVGAQAGAGVNIKLATATWLNLDASYYQGLTDATKNAATNTNQNVRLNVGVMMGL
jgi:hypothetical protein